MLSVADGYGPRPRACERSARQLERRDDRILVPGGAAHSLAEIEDQVGAAAPAQPAEVPQPHAGRLDLVAPAAQDVADVVDVAADRGDIGRGPAFAAGVVDDDDLHAALALRSD